MAIVKLNREYNDTLEMINQGRRGEAVFIPNSLKRMEGTFNLMQSRFTLLGSSSGAGKSSFIDDVFILKPWTDYVKDNPHVHWEVNYYSMERKKLFKHVRWLSWMLYRDHGWLVPVDALLGWDPRGLLGAKVYDVVMSYGDEMSQLLDRVHIYDGRISAKTMVRQIKTKARQLGTLYRADNLGVRIDDEIRYVAEFSEKKLRETSQGWERYVDLEHKGKKFTLTPDTHKYFLHNPNTFFFIVLDGVGLIDDKGYPNTKAAVDAVINVLADARDVYGFSPIAVSQFNRGIADIQRAKLHGSSMGPQESDFKDSSNSYQAADLVIGLFDPYKFKAYDNKGMYGGYDLVGGMCSPNGHNRFRSAHILKNTFGKDSGVFGLKYLGESSYFETLPIAASGDIQNVYARISMGL
jgi:hypothetical protein